MMSRPPRRPRCWTCTHSTVAIEYDDPQQMLDAADQAVEICDRLRLPEPAIALHCRADARLALGDLDGFEDYERAVAAARAQGLGGDRATIELNRVSTLSSLRGPRAACHAAAEAMEFAHRHGLETYVRNSRTQLVSALLDAGEWDQALVDAADILSIVDADDDVAEALYLRSFQARILTERGDAARAAEMLPWLAEKGRENLSFLKGNALLAAGPAYVQLGERDQGVGLLDECLSAPAAVRSNNELVLGAVRSALSVGERSIAERFLACITTEPSARPPLVQHVIASLQALMAEAHGEYQAAGDAFAVAAARWRMFETPYEEGHALLGQGRCLVRLGRQAEAPRPLNQARDLFARLKARPALEETDSLLRSLPRQ